MLYTKQKNCINQGYKTGGKMFELIELFGLKNITPLVNEELKSQIEQKGRACEYEGCGTQDSYPPKMKD